jgi:hypothetical protein
MSSLTATTATATTTTTATVTATTATVTTWHELIRNYPKNKKDEGFMNLFKIVVFENFPTAELLEMEKDQIIQLFISSASQASQKLLNATKMIDDNTTSEYEQSFLAKKNTIMNKFHSFIEEMKLCLYTTTTTNTPSQSKRKAGGGGNRRKSITPSLPSSSSPPPPSPLLPPPPPSLLPNTVVVVVGGSGDGMESFNSNSTLSLPPPPKRKGDIRRKSMSTIVSDNTATTTTNTTTIDNPKPPKRKYVRRNSINIVAETTSSSTTTTSMIKEEQQQEEQQQQQHQQQQQVSIVSTGVLPPVTTTTTTTTTATATAVTTATNPIFDLTIWQDMNSVELLTKNTIHLPKRKEDGSFDNYNVYPVHKLQIELMFPLERRAMNAIVDFLRLEVLNRYSHDDNHHHHHHHHHNQCRILDPFNFTGVTIDVLRNAGFNIKTYNDACDFDQIDEEDNEFDCIITMPPMPLNVNVLQHFYSLTSPQKTFVLLVPTFTLQMHDCAQLFKQNNISVVLLDSMDEVSIPLCFLVGNVNSTSSSASSSASSSSSFLPFPMFRYIEM